MEFWVLPKESLQKSDNEKVEKKGNIEKQLRNLYKSDMRKTHTNKNEKRNFDFHWGIHYKSDKSAKTGEGRKTKQNSKKTDPGNNQFQMGFHDKSWKSCFFDFSQFWRL